MIDWTSDWGRSLQEHDNEYMARLSELAEEGRWDIVKFVLARQITKIQNIWSAKIGIYEI